jgi:hypothetical protein
VSTEDDVLAALGEARAVLGWARTQLVTLSPPSEQLAELIVPNRFLGIRRSGRLRRRGEVWRLGIFLMDANGNLFRAGETVRAENLPHTDHNSAYKAERREIAYLAFRAGYSPGTVVNFRAARIDVDVDSLSNPTSPLFVRGRGVAVRWRIGAPDVEAVLLNDYVAERLDLLLNPPVGSTD